MRRLAAVVALLVPLSAQAAGGIGETSVTTLFWQALNLALLIGVIVYYARKPILSFLRDRRAQVSSDLDSAAGVLSEAERRLEQWQTRADRLDAEIEEIKQAARQRADAEREHVLADAEAAAERIRTDARSAIDREVARARAELRAEAADLATQLAAELLQQNVTDDDQRKLVDEFVARVEASARDGRVH